jgi:hypothetical protein
MARIGWETAFILQLQYSSQSIAVLDAPALLAQHGVNPPFIPFAYIAIRAVMPILG